MAFCTRRRASIYVFFALVYHMYAAKRDLEQNRVRNDDFLFAFVHFAHFVYRLDEHVVALVMRDFD